MTQPFHLYRRLIGKVLGQSISPISFVDSYLNQEGHHLSVSRFEDAGEFLIELFERLDRYYQQIGIPSPIRKYFHINLATVYLCSQGHSVRKPRQDSSFMLSLPIQGATRLTEALNTFISGSLTDTHCAWCERHQSQSQVNRKTLLSYLPNTFILQLQRFVINKKENPQKKDDAGDKEASSVESPLAYTKDNSFLSFPFEDLDLKPYTVNTLHAYPKDYFIYHLVGIIAHQGSPNSGHYVSFIKERAHPNRWLFFSDSIVRVVPVAFIKAICYGTRKIIKDKEELSLSCSAYILLYERDSPRNDWIIEQTYLTKEQRHGLPMVLMHPATYVSSPFQVEEPDLAESDSSPSEDLPKDKDTHNSESDQQSEQEADQELDPKSNHSPEKDVETAESPTSSQTPVIQQPPPVEETPVTLSEAQKQPSEQSSHHRTDLSPRLSKRHYNPISCSSESERNEVLQSPLARSQEFVIRTRRMKEAAVPKKVITVDEDDWGEDIPSPPSPKSKAKTIKRKPNTPYIDLPPTTPTASDKTPSSDHPPSSGKAITSTMITLSHTDSRTQTPQPSPQSETQTSSQKLSDLPAERLNPDTLKTVEGKPMYVEKPLLINSGFIDRFRLKRGIVYGKFYGEAAASDLASGNKWVKTELPRLIFTYGKENIINADESGLYWRRLPETGLVYEGESATGGKLSKERITIMLAATMDGEKLQPFVIGHSALRPTYSPPVDFAHNPKAYMNQPLFEEWISVLNQRMQQQDRTVAVVVDNCSSHTINGSYEHVKLYKLPKNVTSTHQPCDAGIIASHKKRYRTQFLISLYDKATKTISEHKTFTIEDALQTVYDVWRSISKDTIVNCFEKAWSVQFTARAEVDVDPLYLDSLEIDNEQREVIKTAEDKMRYADEDDDVVDEPGAVYYDDAARKNMHAKGARTPIGLPKEHDSAAFQQVVKELTESGNPVYVGIGESLKSMEPGIAASAGKKGKQITITQMLEKKSEA